MGGVSYDPNTTYVVVASEYSGLFESLEDLNSNMYSYESDFTYSNNITNLNMNFNSNADANSTFFSPTFISQVILGNNVSKITDIAFQSCSLLSSITIPSSVTSIASNAFDGISKNVTLNWGGTNIVVPDYFYNNLNLNGYNVTYYPSYTPPSPTTTVEATYTLTSSGTDATGNVVTTTSSFTASASGDSIESATNSMHDHAHKNFLLPNTTKFSRKHQNDTHTLTFTYK